ncbi:MAG: hypothetical protein HQK54_03845 [Oligoflexales bacterium]|nr:hypothetical protein [Oligoflexales bacterium]
MSYKIKFLVLPILAAISFSCEKKKTANELMDNADQKTSSDVMSQVKSGSQSLFGDWDGKSDLPGVKWRIQSLK